MPEKDRQAQFFHKFGAISKASKVLTSKMKHAGGSEDVIRLQNLFPLPGENFESPIQLCHDPIHHWPSDDEILELWNTPEMEEWARKYHFIGALCKYVRSKPLLCAPDVGGWRIKDQFQRIFLSSDPDNDELKALIHDCFYMSWLTGAYLPDFAPELAGSYLIALEKPNGGIRGIAPVDIWRTTTGNAIVQAVQPFAAKVCIEAYPSFKQLALSKDSASHFKSLVPPQLSIL
jgi:hypothetical protein